MIVQVKENQKKLLASCEKIAHEAVPVETSLSRTIGRNRKERRRIKIFDALHSLPISLRAGWNHLIASVIQVTRTKKEFDAKSKAWIKSKEIAYYIGTRLFSARVSGTAIRRHWWIENSNHYVRDVSMGEDSSRIRVNPECMVILRSIGLNVMRDNGVKNVKQARFRNSLNLETVLRYKQIRE